MTLSSIDISQLDDAELALLASDVHDELTYRSRKYDSPSDFDPDLAYETALEFINQDDLFIDNHRNEGLTTVHEITPGVIAIPGIIRDLNKNGSRHECILATVRSKKLDVNESWAWDPSPDKEEYFIGAKTIKLGGLRRSVSLYKVFPGMIVVFHTREFDGRMHRKIKMDALALGLDEDRHVTAHVIKSGILQNLPLPPTTENV